MIEVTLQTEKLIDTLNETDFVNNMFKLRKEIIDNKLYYDRENEVIKEYIKNQNIFDFHIYYLNKEIDKLINNKVCRSKDESN